MADVLYFIVDKLDRDPRLRAVPPPVIREIAMLTLYELAQASKDDAVLGNLIHGDDWSFCDACADLVERRSIHLGPDFEEYCDGCYRGLGLEEEE